MRLGKLVPSVLAFGTMTWLGCGGSNGVSTVLIPDTEGGVQDGSAEGSAADGSGMSSNDGGGALGDAGGPGGDTTTIPCGGNACSIPAQICCINTGGGGSGGANTTYTCATGSCGKVVVDGGDAAAAGGSGDVTALGCTDTANCAAGSICCIHQPANGGIVAECTVGATCGNNAAQLCDPGAVMTGCPASGKNAVCSSKDIGSWGLTPPFATCGGIGN